MKWKQFIDVALQQQARLGDVDVRRWPLFETHAIMPHGITAPRGIGAPYVWNAGHCTPCVVFEGDQLVEVWPEEAACWWPTHEVDRLLDRVRRGLLPMPAETLLGRGAIDTCCQLWRARSDWLVAAAVLYLAWWHDARKVYKRTPVASRMAVATASAAYAFAHAGDCAIRYHHWSRGTCGDLRGYDPITLADRVLDSQASVARAFLTDAHVAQTSWARLVHLRRDPEFDPDAFLGALREERRQREREQEERDQRREAKVQAWQRELARREEYRRLYRGFGARAAAAELGTSLGALQNWARRGFSLEQIQWLARRPKGTRGKSLDEQLIGAGLVSGLAAGDEWVVR